MRRREIPSSKRPVFPTSIVTNVSLNSPRRRNAKQQKQGRPISSVFITQDPVRQSYVFFYDKNFFYFRLN